MGKKIMFSDKYGLTKAVLEGRKTQTRRGITYPRQYKGTNVAGFHVYTNVESGKVTEVCMYDEDERDIDEGQLSPRYKVGEVVAIAQSYYEIGLHPNTIVGTKKDGAPIPAIQSKGWKNKMFVKAEFMPRQIRITNVRIQKLQDITNDDCLAEGVRLFTANGKNQYVVDGLGHFRSMGCTLFGTPKEAYAALINKIGKKGDWESNHYCWVYEFELVK